MAGPAALVIAALIPLVAWARIALGRHTLGQAIAGALVGGLIYTTAFLFIPAA
jgi:membrane-associated phospholipid phosphatase